MKFTQNRDVEWEYEPYVEVPAGPNWGLIGGVAFCVAVFASLAVAIFHG